MKTNTTISKAAISPSQNALSTFPKTTERSQTANRNQPERPTSRSRRTVIEIAGKILANPKAPMIITMISTIPSPWVVPFTREPIDETPEAASSSHKIA